VNELFHVLEQSYLDSAPLLIGLLGVIGLGVGVVTGLFGVGGAFMITPLLNVMLGIPYSLAVGSSLSFTIGTSSGAWMRHLRLGNVAPKTMLILGGSAVCGTVLGADLHGWLRASFGAGGFTLVMHGTFIGLLVLVAALVWFGRGEDREGFTALQRLPLPPRITIRGEGGWDVSGVSLPGLCAMGLLMGVGKGLLGIGGGVLFMPILLTVVGLSMHRSVGTSLGVVLFSSLAGVILYGVKGEASLWIVMPLLIGSCFGIQIGVWLCQRLGGRRLRGCFAALVCVVAMYIGSDFVRKLTHAAPAEPPAASRPAARTMPTTR
jgi:uncharacterized membrane protein YfcA